MVWMLRQCVGDETVMNDVPPERILSCYENLETSRRRTLTEQSLVSNSQAADHANRSVVVP